ncbi:hypothetical protein N474_25515 [Pseudoalteromonas luteoviolacea CPMOR-2]|nr:hypothetical protein N474_25515 [Pseudoalteromonas luteoviolacea CPMOR-2]
MVKRYLYLALILTLFGYLVFIGYELYIDINELKLFTECTNNGYVILEDADSTIKVECTVMKCINC